ncbi:outer membrane protein [Pseudochrobactrum sp. HB0163]|uniref:outer membrane protein n=1 Tax=Pseudochrobactrum sp. HB0163 TaxID=3450708 RepID=UPI003F6DAADE
MKKFAALLAMTVFAGHAFAADAIVSAPEPAPVEYPAFSWTGGYIGAHGGYGWASMHDVNNPEASKVKPKGGFGGLQAGYNWQFDNNVVLGAEADVSFGKIKKSWDGRDTNQYDSYYGEDKIGTHGTVRARLGYAVDRFLPYVTGGIAFAEAKHTLGCDVARVSNTTGCGGKANNGKFEDKASKTRVGYTVGAGVEYAVTDNWTVKAEYLYSNYGKKNVTLYDPYKTQYNERRFKTDLNEVRFGVNYKF